MQKNGHWTCTKRERSLDIQITQHDIGYIYIYTYMASYHNYNKGWWMEAWFSIPNLPIRLMISKKFRKKFQRRKFQHNRQHFQGAKKKRLMFSISRNRFFHFDWLLIPVGWRSPFEKSPKPFFWFHNPKQFIKKNLLKTQLFQKRNVPITWRITPLSKFLGTPLYRPFRRGTLLLREAYYHHGY